MIVASILFVAAMSGGAIAAIAGFGIGSVLTPLLALKTGLKLAVAAVTIPHMVGTAVRLWLLRRSVHRQILLSFGITSAAGGLIGAVLHTEASGRALAGIFGGLLIFAGLTGVTGLARRMKFKGLLAWIGGGLSGLFGGLVGNQGGIRSAAMLGLDVPRDSFVATATAIALIVDLARTPVYLYTSGSELWEIRYQILIALAGVIIGTIGGGRLLKRIPESSFLKMVSLIVLALGIWTLVKIE